MTSLIALVLAQSLAGAPAPAETACPLDRIREQAGHHTAHASSGEPRCRVVLVEPVRASDPPPCHVEQAPPRPDPRTDCPRIRLYEETHYERREQHASTERRSHREHREVRAGDVITLGAIGVATLDGGVGASAAPVFISHGGSVFVSSASSAFASSSASASAHASARFRFSGGGHHGGGGGKHGGH